jgi:DNA invertase Pin-like site-specific DNA recombinase
MTDYGYARVSTRDQDPQLQINALEQAGCWPIVKEHASGVAKRRPVLDEILAQLRPGDRLTIWKLDRLGRSVIFLNETIKGLAERGVAFRSLTDNIDTSTPQGRLQLNMMASFAEFERELIKERTLAGKARMRAEGRHTGGPALFGWEPDHVSVNEAEAALIQEVAARVLQHEPLARIIRDLNQRDVPRPRRGGSWRVTPMRRILVNPTTAMIVDDHQALVRALTRPGRKAQGRPSEHLLSGILVDAGCGLPLYAVQKPGEFPQWVYRCHRGSGGCGNVSIAQGRADRWAREAFLAAVVSEDFSQALNQRQAELLAGETTAEELDAWREELGDIEQVQGTRFYNETMKQRHADLRRMVDQATTRLLEAPELEEMMSLPKSEDKLRERWASWTVAQRRTWLRRLVHRIEVHPPAELHGPATDVESRLRPVWKM